MSSESALTWCILFTGNSKYNIIKYEERMKSRLFTFDCCCCIRWLRNCCKFTLWKKVEHNYLHIYYLGNLDIS